MRHCHSSSRCCPGCITAETCADCSAMAVCLAPTHGLHANASYFRRRLARPRRAPRRHLLGRRATASWRRWGGRTRRLYRLSRAPGRLHSNRVCPRTPAALHAHIALACLVRRVVLLTCDAESSVQVMFRVAIMLLEVCQAARALRSVGVPARSHWPAAQWKVLPPERMFQAGQHSREVKREISCQSKRHGATILGSCLLGPWSLAARRFWM